MKETEKPASRMIWDLRRAMNLTQLQFGRQIGATKVTVCRWEKGLAVPDRRHTRRLRELAETVKNVLSRTEKRKYPVDWRF